MENQDILDDNESKYSLENLSEERLALHKKIIEEEHKLEILINSLEDKVLRARIWKQFLEVEAVINEYHITT